MLELLSPDTALLKNGVVTIESFDLADQLHPYFDLPSLKRAPESRQHTTVHSDVSFGFFNLVTILNTSYLRPFSSSSPHNMIAA